MDIIHYAHFNSFIKLLSKAHTPMTNKPRDIITFNFYNLKWVTEYIIILCHCTMLGVELTYSVTMLGRNWSTNTRNSSTCWLWRSHSHFINCMLFACYMTFKIYIHIHVHINIHWHTDTYIRYVTDTYIQACMHVQYHRWCRWEGCRGFPSF